MQNENPSILLIYTGGTIGMYENPLTGALENFNFDRLREYLPELARFGYRISSLAFDPPIDSSNIEPSCWKQLVRIISDNYDTYDGFVILHGTDTMAYTASALSFMLENLAKPVILTGSQLPIGQIRTDGKENVLTAIEIAAARDAQGQPMVPEVCIFFERKLLRGNRTSKISADGFSAFRSHNCPELATAGVHIVYNKSEIRRPNPNLPIIPHYDLDDNIVALTLFPGIRREIVTAILQLPGLKGVILKTYGSGNAPKQDWFLNLIIGIQQRGVIVVNITQCLKGTVEMERYETGLQLLKAGVINGYDSTIEGMITKLMFLFGQHYDSVKVRKLLNQSLVGEITLNE